MAAVRTVKVRFAGDASGLSKAAKDGEKSLGRFGGAMDRFGQVAGVASLAIVGAAGVAGKALFDLSKSMTLLDKKAKVVFEDQLAPMKAWAEANRKAFGLSSRQVLDLAADLADLLKPMGFTAEAAAGMSTKLLDLAGALSQWTGGTKSAAEVSDILTKALLGERDGLKALGISISEEDVKAQLAKTNSDKLTGAALEQARARATLTLITEKSTDAQAAWANGGKEAAEKAGALNSSIEESKEKLATALAPAFAEVAKRMEEFANWADNNEGALKNILVAVTALSAAIVVIAAAQKAWMVVMAAWKVAVGIATVVQWAWNVALTANPIGVIIVAVGALIAVIVWLATKTQFFQTIWKAYWAFVTAYFRFLKDTVWGQWIKPVFMKIFEIQKKVINWFLEFGGKIKTALSGVAETIFAPFKWAFNKIAEFWNATAGQLTFTLPDWVPGIGGNTFSMPKLPVLHTGGIVPGGTSEDVPILAQGGEGVFTREQMRALGGAGTIEVHVHVGDEVVRVVRHEIAGATRQASRLAVAGAGRR